MPSNGQGFFPVALLLSRWDSLGLGVRLPTIMQARTEFSHRPVPDGLTVAFCNKCFATIATSHWEAELDQAERQHVCDPYLLEQWKKLTDAIHSGKADLG